jgi:hypothetical protein
MTTPVLYRLDEVERGQALLTDRYQKPLIRALLASWLAEVQEVEIALVNVGYTGLITPLDRLGRIVGEAREGRADDLYSTWILGRIMVNRSSGKPEQLIALAVVLGGLIGIRVRYEELYPAAAIIHYDDPSDPSTGVQIAKLMQLAKPAGVRLLVEWFSGTAGEPFEFATGSASEFDGEHGFDQGALAAVSDGGTVVFAP